MEAAEPAALVDPASRAPQVLGIPAEFHGFHRTRHRVLYLFGCQNN
jgi:hypothetical protein